MQASPRQLEDISRIRDAMIRMSQTAMLAVELLDAKIEDEGLDGRSEATETRKVLEEVQNLSLEISEELDAYQELYSKLIKIFSKCSGSCLVMYQEGS